MLNKAFYNKLAVSIMAFGFMASLCACSNERPTVTTETLSSEQLEEIAIERNNARVRKFIKDKLGFELDDELFEEAELAFDSSKRDSHGRAGIVIKQGKENDVLSLLEKNLGMEKNIGPNLIPAELNNEYAADLRTMDLVKYWELSETSVYMSRKGSYSFLYIFA